VYRRPARYVRRQTLVHLQILFASSVPAADNHHASGLDVIAYAPPAHTATLALASTTQRPHNQCPHECIVRPVPTCPSMRRLHQDLAHAATTIDNGSKMLVGMKKVVAR
jgi:hypothetical protein